ncbi:MAG: adenylosuccinate lyase [Saprospiraceae bacterium]|nr:adenylosuccinate lyase [Saprospiraceae bacterium]
MLTAVSPIDGRYIGKTKALSEYFSEFALIKYRVKVEMEYFKYLVDQKVGMLSDFPTEAIPQLDKIVEDFSLEDGQKIKDIEKETNHDVKAVEYFIKNKFDEIGGLERFKEFIHFGLTSQDINNTSLPLMVKDALSQVLKPALNQIIDAIQGMSTNYKGISMLAKTHGQPASPTTLGKEFAVFVERLSDQMDILNALPIKAKFGGATGNLNAHKVSFPNHDWISFADTFVEEKLGLKRSKYTTQIAHYDHLGAICHTLARIDTILIDFCRDVWTYIMMEYFKQKVVANEVGSSAMPHKVNPIDFENAEGNLGIANAILEHLAAKLPISRLQRDLTDSTVIRNVGVPFGHILIACLSMQKGIGKLQLNEPKLTADLEANWAVVAEAIQNILRREGYPKPYEALKELTRGKTTITKQDIHNFIRSLKVSSSIQEELLAITPLNYVGYY